MLFTGTHIIHKTCCTAPGDNRTVSPVIASNLIVNTFARYAIISSKLSPALAAVNTAAAGALSCGALVFTTRGYLVLHTILL